MKKLFLMLLAAGLFSFGAVSCDSRQENAAEERADDLEDAADEVEDEVDEGEIEEAADELEDNADNNERR